VPAEKPPQFGARQERLNMNVLGFDSAGQSCAAAVLRDGRVAARRFVAMERGQAALLLPMIEAVLAEAGLGMAGLDLIAATVGPGAFTGLRIGLAAARGLALASGVPVIGVTTFAAVAAAVPAALRAGRSLLVALDSKRAELFVQAFADDRGACGDGALVAPADLAAWVPAGPLLLAGDAAPRAAAALSGRDVAMAPGPGQPDAVDVARLGAGAWRPGSRPPLPVPLYLRPPDTTLPRRSVAAR
jgi:tRNA threonylcarbamoyladenosine biosynthesis protein TsaB